MYSYCNLFTSSSSLFMIGIIILILIQVPLSLCQENHQYETCRESFRCLDIENISYPFYGGNRPDYCGHPGFQLTNCEGEYGNFPVIVINLIPYSVLAIDKNVSSLTVRREDLLYDLCSSESKLGDIRLNFTLFDYGPDERNLTLYYDCPTGPTLHRLPCRMNSERSNYFMPDIPDEGNMKGCKREIKVPINQTSYQILTNPSASIDDLTAALTAGFGLNYLEGDTNCSRCLGSGGLCGHNWATNSFTCHCKEGSYPLDCSDALKKGDNSRRRRRNMKKNIVIVSIVAAAVGVMGIGWLIFFCRQRRKRLVANSAQIRSKELPGPTTMSNKRLIFPPSSMFTGSVASYPSSISNFGKGNSYFGVQVFSYTELEEATDNFDSSRELGDGGFGTVYCGQLRDGRIVAIKRLYENNCRRVEQFMNELEILTRLHHDNLVILYGCTSRRSRELLLVYEYIPNGTVADHLHGKRAKSGLLSWPVRLSIAVETADALAYLHESDIIHRDVKTNNILLDNEFHVKVADFGLSRLFPNDVSHVSTAPQGTPGYVDPEYYQCYQLTEKSDVYSFGVVLIELISSLQAVDICRHRHDINLSNMAINKIQNGELHELVDPSLGFATYSSVRRTTTLVAELAFRCLQHEKDMRPSMKEVLDTLRRIRNEGMNTKEVEVVDILVDDGAPLNGNPPHSPDSVITDKWVSNSTIDSSC